MLTWLSVAVQWHRVIVHRWQASSHRDRRIPILRAIKPPVGWLASEDASKFTPDLLG
ncbi:hypothetical protein ACVWYU_001181 [Pseudomonas sp. TE12234]